MKNLREELIELHDKRIELDKRASNLDSIVRQFPDCRIDNYGSLVCQEANCWVTNAFVQDHGSKIVVAEPYLTVDGNRVYSLPRWIRVGHVTDAGKWVEDPGWKEYLRIHRISDTVIAEIESRLKDNT